MSQCMALTHRLTRPRIFAWCPVLLFAGLVLGPASPSVVAQSGGELAGEWRLDRAASQFPREVGFGAEFLPVGRGDGSSSDSTRGRRSSGSGGLSPALRPQGESFDEGTRRQRLTDEVRNPPARLTIVDAADTVTFSDEKGGVRTLHPDGRAETLRLDAVPVLAVARREAGTLVVLYSVADLRQLRYTYSRPEGTASLLVDVEFVERGQVGDKVRRVYTASEPPRTTSAAGPGAESAGRGNAPSGGGPPAGMPRAGSEFAGLRRIGIVVEDLSTQAAACGLTRAALEAAVAKPFTDASLKTATNSDEDTYVHVTMMTSTLPTGMCISRYDWSIYSTTEATLSYQRSPLLAQVLLAHKGGLTGSMPAVHAADVVRGMTEGLTQIAGIIRDANR